jgi:hypothetical protein
MPKPATFIALPIPINPRKWYIVYLNMLTNFKTVILSVTLEDIAGFLCIKAMQGIEKFLGYGLETVLNSMFCYKLPERAPDSEPPPVSCLVVGCKGTARLCRLPKQELYSETAKYYSQFLTISFTVIFIFFIGILKYLWKQHHVLQWG